MMKRVFIVLMAMLIASPMFVSLIPVHAQILRNENSEPLILSSSPITGNDSTDWQKDTVFTNGKIEVWKDHPSELEISIRQGGWWYGNTKTNSTWVSMQQTSFLSGDYVYLECKNNDIEQIKCWLRGSVSSQYNFWIDLSGGIWNQDTYVYATGGVQMNFTDIVVYGFPMIWDTENSKLGIKVSGVFDIDPTISGTKGTGLYQHNVQNQGDIAVTVGHFDYLFLQHSGSNTWDSTWENTLQYMFKNSSQPTWYNGTEYYSANRTYAANYPYLQNGVTKLDDGDAGWDFKTNGTHIYGFVATDANPADKGGCGHGQKRSGGTAGCWLVFKPVTGSDPDATEIVTEGYVAGQLKLIINASVPCLASVPGTCSTSDDDGPQYSVSVSMNSTGYPAIAYSYKETATGNSNFNWGIVLQRAENPVHTTGCVAPDTGLYRACDEFDARNGANGTWTNPQQVDTEAEIIAGGSGHGYIWTNHQEASPAAEYANYWTDIALCSMGSGNFLVVGKNATIEASTSQDIYARFWYQGNATWGTPFPIDAAGDHHHYDNLDLTCIQNSVAVFTAHLVWTKYQYPSDSNITTWVYYTNFTSAAYDGPHVGDGETIWRIDTATADYRETRPENRPENVDITGHGEIIYSAGIVGDNSTGAITVFYHTSYGRIYYNTTGWYGSEGFKTSGRLYDAGCRVTGASGADDICYNSQYKQPGILSVQPLMNGTDITSYIPIFYSGGTGTSKGIGYIQFSNVTSPVIFHFYDQQGTPIPIENMTLYYNFNQTSLTVGAGLDCSSCTVGLTPGFYNLTAIYRANTDKKINVTTTQFYIDAGNNTASFIVGNVSIIFNLRQEKSLLPWDIENKNVYADIWVENEKTTTLINLINQTIWLAKEPTNIQIRYQANPFNASRWESNPGPRCVSSTGCNYAMTFYLSEYDEYFNYNYQFTLVDPTVTKFVNGTFIVRKHTADGLVEISEQLIPKDSIVKVTLIFGEEYVFEVLSANGLSQNSLGTFLADVDLAQSMFIDSIIFAPEILIQQKYIHWDVIHNRTAGTIRFWYQDANNRSSLISYQIYNRSGIQLTANTTIQEFDVIWTGASSNATQVYFIRVVVDHLDFGKITEAKAIPSYGSPANWINFGRCPGCSVSLIEPDSPWFVYVSGAAVIFMAGLFSTASAAAGMLILAVWVAMLYQFGFFPGMESIIVVFILLYAVIGVFSYRRGFRG